MKILIIGTIYADCDDREETLCQHLSSGLKQRGHEIEVCYLPFKRGIDSVTGQIFAYDQVCTNRAEAIITVGYPACFIQHWNEKKVSYIFDIIPEVHSKLCSKIQGAVFLASEGLKHEMSFHGNMTATVTILPPDDIRLTDRIEETLVV